MEHFVKHGADLGAHTVDEYEAMADRFMAKPVTSSVHECIRPGGTMICRYDSSTEEYGTMYIGGYLITYFRPIAAPHIPGNKRPKNMHGWSTNLAYFQDKCR